jgi:hypothetical protein
LFDPTCVVGVIRRNIENCANSETVAAAACQDHMHLSNAIL